MKIQQFFTKHFTVIQTCLFILLLIFSFVLCFWISSKVITRPSTPEKIEYMKQIAFEIYENSDSNLIEAPEDIHIEKTPTKIIVSEYYHSGKLEATLKNGELVFTYNNQTLGAIFLNTLVGLMGFLITCYILIKIDEKKNAKNRYSY